jgi:spore germination protein YaaH
MQLFRPIRPVRAQRRPVLAAAAVAATALALVPALPAGAATEVPPARIVSGWMPYWTTGSSLSTITANKAVYSEVSPFWYAVSGSFAAGTSITQQVSDSDKATAMGTLRRLGIPAWPTVTDSTRARQLSAVMQNTAKRKALVSQLAGLAVSEGYQGLDLDFERFAFSDGSSTWSTTRPAWVEFVKELAAALHATGRKLSVTTPPLCSMNSVCNSGTGYWVYDWKGVGAYADVVRIMAYDYSWDVPGPIGPFDWTEANVRYAASLMPARKVEIGIPTYGYDWVRRNPDGSQMVVGTCPSGVTIDTNRHEVDADGVPALLAQRGVSPKAVVWNDTYKESTFNYTRVYNGTIVKGGKAVATTCRVYRVVWYGSARAVLARAGLVGKYKIRGITTWTIGGEDPAQWNPLTAYAESLASGQAPQSVAGVSSSTAPVVAYGATTRITASASRPKGTPAALLWQPFGSRAWSKVATGVLDAQGAVTFARQVVFPGAFRVVVAGAGYGRPMPFKVVSRVGARVSSTSPAAYTPVTMTVTTAPARGAQLVSLQLWLPSGWVTTATARTRANGTAVFTKIGGRPGSLYTYRAVVATSVGIVGASSPWMRFRTR